MKKKVDELEDELRTEYDFATMYGCVKGKYVQRYRSARSNAIRTGIKLVRLNRDAATADPTEASANEAIY